MSLAEDVDLEEFVTAKDDLSGADIKAVCTEAGLLALRERRMRVMKADFTAAREKVRAALSPDVLEMRCVDFFCRGSGAVQEERGRAGRALPLVGSGPVRLLLALSIVRFWFMFFIIDSISMSEF